MLNVFSVRGRCRSVIVTTKVVGRLNRWSERNFDFDFAGSRRTRNRTRNIYSRKNFRSQLNRSCSLLFVLSEMSVPYEGSLSDLVALSEHNITVYCRTEILNFAVRTC
jgi:hypothetical protein